jgi:hypothetical protein
MCATVADEAHFKRVIRVFLDGDVVPFLGSGVNKYSRPSGARWARGSFLPDGGELATYLAEEFDYPIDSSDVCPPSLSKVSQYADLMEGSARLYKKLRHLLDADYPITSIHRLLATLPGRLREKGYAVPPPLIVTTNYDDVLERAFEQQEFDLVWYVADGQNRGRFIHRAPNGEQHLVEDANRYDGIPMDADQNLARPAILKIHGAVHRVAKDPSASSFVITEDHYLDYLTHTDLSQLLPLSLATKLSNSGFLFLGYSLVDWNVRVILRRMWQIRNLDYTSWAIRRSPDPFEEKFWKRTELELVQADLGEYVAELSSHIDAFPVQ